MKRLQKIQDLKAIKIRWSPAKGKTSWAASVLGEQCELRMNDFPDEPLYTVSWRDERFDIDDLPAHWLIDSENAEPNCDF